MHLRTLVLTLSLAVASALTTVVVASELNGQVAQFDPEIVRLAAALPDASSPAAQSAKTSAADVASPTTPAVAETKAPALTFFPSSDYVKGPPLPLHTIEGTGGVVITPLAYLVNPGPKNSIFGEPAASFTYVGAGEKNIQALGLTETLFGRIELGYGLSRFGLGSLPDAVHQATGINIGRSDVYLHSLNARFLLVEENSYNLPLPAITAGVQYKINEGIGTINNNLGGLLTKKGLGHTSGEDYTLTASKTFGNVLGRPLIVTAGLRESKAAQIGYLGFGNDYNPSFEGNVVYLITDWLALAYEVRQKINDYQNVGTLVQKEDSWQTVGLGFVINKHLTATVGWGHFGRVLDTVEDAGYAVSLKYEF